MARGTSFVVGELARRSSLAGADVTVSMTALKANRSRAEARYTVEVKFSDQDAMGLVPIDDAGGYREKFRFADVAAWLARHLSAKDCAVTLVIEDASRLGVGFKAARLAKRGEQLAAVDLDAKALAAIEKIATVTPWVASARRSEVLGAGGNMLKCVDMVEWLRDGGTPPVAEQPDSVPVPVPVPGPGPVPGPVPVPVPVWPATGIVGRPVSVPSDVRGWMVLTRQQLYRLAPFYFGYMPYFSVVENTQDMPVENAIQLARDFCSAVGIRALVVDRKTGWCAAEVSAAGVMAWSVFDTGIDWVTYDTANYRRFAGRTADGIAPEHCLLLDLQDTAAGPVAAQVTRRTGLFPSQSNFGPFEQLTAGVHYGANSADGARTWPLHDSSAAARRWGVSQSEADAAYRALFAPGVPDSVGRLHYQNGPTPP